MRRGRARISYRGCVGIIEAAANLSLSGDLGWTVKAAPRIRTPSELVPALLASRVNGVAFVLPFEAKAWFPLSYAVPDACFPLAFQYVWALSTIQARGHPPAAGRTVVDLVVWWLSRCVPAEDLERARQGLSAAQQRLEAGE